MQNIEKKQIISIIIVVGFIIAGVILLRGTKAPTTENKPIVNNNDYTSLVALQGGMISLDDHITGNPNAELVIIEYSDLECPFCRIFHATMHQVIETNQNVAWVYRHYPIPQLHQKAFYEAEATECAWEQGGDEAFWKYADRIFAITPSNDGLDTSELPRIAEYVGLNVQSFNACLASGKFKNKIQADIDRGVIDGVNGTPSSFIIKNGQVVGTIPGALPYQSVIQTLSQIR
ncbi:hypothetical protein A2814_01885 [Candidatus Nomurabacteria bacterium RIFCSPHIGHO2_01_FULL_38_19]|uniref:Thioredoxin domain-containing protein n=1 Tax=Candidatus Nomurabacteria bacterium RIFCSPHIGHO2_01_FULL_38_19 TaxID=1801732 RepID=A0A1F6UUK2_9BACT|nr:MAG: hypothetical protein A2814_01885 [Candidatus Nomurabacteria bacterium RIFCSPHIGHO2_01_FULL_38_19]